MNREARATIAQETLVILARGVYQGPNQATISIGAELAAACAQTTLYRPEDHTAILSQVDAQPKRNKSVIQVRNQTTLAAAKALRQQYQTVACLNFASAKRPGGGFLSGSQAQEESLARASGLFATLQTKPEFYAYHKQLGTSFYSDHAIFSPAVPIFRDDADQLLDQPWQTAFITAAAVNAGAIRRNERKRQGNIIPVMERRTRMVLGVAALHQCEALVLGAWGCGVFQNDPQQIAAVFAKVLAEPLFQQRFAQVEFAIYDVTSQQATLAAFNDVFKNT